jgi:hypothetical protein
MPIPSIAEGTIAVPPRSTPMTESFKDPAALVPQDLSPADSRRYEELTVESLRQAMIHGGSALVAIDAIDLVGARPDTVVVVRYHHQPDYVGRDPALVAGPRAEVANLWEPQSIPMTRTRKA